jgi:hypothetical protein
MEQQLDRYLELVTLQKETKGATFTIAYSTKKDMHSVRFSNKHKKFEHIFLSQAIEDSILWIKATRKDHKQGFTLFN